LLSGQEFLNWMLSFPSSIGLSFDTRLFEKSIRIYVALRRIEDAKIVVAAFPYFVESLRFMQANMKDCEAFFLQKYKEGIYQKSACYAMAILQDLKGEESARIRWARMALKFPDLPEKRIEHLAALSQWKA